MQEMIVTEPREIVITDEQTDLMKRTICQGATDAEMQLFFYDCRRRGVHPLDKLIHFTKRKGKYTPITSIDFFRIRAHATNEFDGEDEPVFSLGPDKLPDTCTYVVYRKGRSRPWHATARWDEYYPGEEIGFMWRKMPFLMLSKCAEALALRKAFPAELQGLYVKEEMDQAGPERNPPIDAAAPRGGKSSQEAERATEPVKSGGTINPSEDLPDPAEPHRVKLRVCERTPEVITRTYNAIPPEIRQDCHGEFQLQLRHVTKKRVGPNQI